MTEIVTREALAHVAAITDAPPVAGSAVRSEIDRSFELPTGLYVATVGLYLGFIGLMGAAFVNPGLVLPLVIFALFVIAAFGTPALWVRMTPEQRQRAMTYGQFRHRGIQTATGPLGAGAAAVQVLVLPVLIFVWAIAIVTIAAAT